MNKIPDGSVDLILADPPYGTTACKWDSVIPFEPMWTQLKRVAKKNAAIVLFGSEPFSSALRMSNLSMFKYDWVWVKSKGAGFLNAKNAPIKMHENISVFSDGATANRSQRRVPYFPQGLTQCGRVRAQPDYCDSVGTRPSRSREYTQQFQNYPSTILKYRNDGGKQHPTQKPVALLEYLILTYTQEGETVLDFTMGSGSTGVACVNTGRRFIGIELDENYYHISRKRIEEALHIVC